MDKCTKYHIVTSFRLKPDQESNSNFKLVDGKVNLLLDDWFILVAAALRFLLPTRRTLLASSVFCTLIHLKSTKSHKQHLKAHSNISFVAPIVKGLHL